MHNTIEVETYDASTMACSPNLICICFEKCEPTTVTWILVGDDDLLGTKNCTEGDEMYSKSPAFSLNSMSFGDMWSFTRADG